MLSQRVQEFIHNIGIMARAHSENGISCLLVVKDKLKELVSELKNANIEGISFAIVDRKTGLEEIKPPALLVVTEEDYASDESFAESIRAKAAYFLNI